MLYIISTDLESLIRKTDGCTNNPEKSSTTKLSEKYFSDIQCPKIKKNDEDGNESIVAISYKIKYIDSSSVMTSPLSNFDDISQKNFTKLNVKIAIVFLNMKVSRTI